MASDDREDKRLTEDAPQAEPFQYGENKMNRRLDETTRSANEIIARERAARDAKTERLKAARLAQERKAADADSSS